MCQVAITGDFGGETCRDPSLRVNEKTLHMALLSANKAEAVTNGWGKATIPMSKGHVGPFPCSSQQEPRDFKHSFGDERKCPYEVRTFVTRKTHRDCAGQRCRRWRSDGLRCNISRTGSGPRHHGPGARYSYAGRGEPR